MFVKSAHKTPPFPLKVLYNRASFNHRRVRAFRDYLAELGACESWYYDTGSCPLNKAGLDKDRIQVYN
jgi:hypothetical protein